MVGRWQRSASRRDDNDINLLAHSERAVKSVRASIWRIPEGAEFYATYAEILKRVPQSQAKDDPDPMNHASKDELILIFERLSLLYLTHIKAKDIASAHIIEARIITVFDKLDNVFGIPHVEDADLIERIQMNEVPPNWRELI